MRTTGDLRARMKRTWPQFLFRVAARLRKSASKALEAEFGQLPADFEPDPYIDLHPDLERFRTNPGAAIEHYLRHGRPEGRPYKRISLFAFKQLPSGEPDAGETEQLADVRVWTNRFNVADFRALNPDLAEGIETREQAIAAFLERGIDRLSPLALDEPFDPDFYRLRHPDAVDLDPAAAYRHWLFKGLPEGRPGSEAELIRNVTWDSSFPDAFDWETYARSLPAAAGPRTRWNALDHLIEQGVARADAVPLRDNARPTDAAKFLETVATQQWSRSRRKLAVELLQKALALDPTAGGCHWKFGAWKEELHEPDAEDHYKDAQRNGYASVYLVAKLVEMAARRGAFDEAYAQLRSSREALRGHGPWVEAFDSAVQQDFGNAAKAALESYRKGERERGDAVLQQALTRITQRLEELDDLPARLPPARDGHVVLFSNQSLAQCRHYRVEQRCRQLRALSLPFRLFDSDEPVKAREALVGARSLIVYREPAYPETIRLILHARAMGIPVFYEIDDLIFDSKYYPDSFETYRKQIPFEDYVGLQYGVPLFRFAATLCDEGITSTSALARHLGPLTRTRLCHVIPNGLDDRNDRFLAARSPVRRPEDDVFVFYGSGGKAHNRNFNETAGPALAEVMAARPRVKLVIVGYLDLDPAFEPFSDRILRYDFSDLETYWSVLSEADINLAVLVPGEMNDAKSEIKWIEAAVSGVPSIVSATATYEEVLNDGRDALLARSVADWRDALFRLVDDPDLRRSIGTRAGQRVLADYGLARTAAKLASLLNATGARSVGARRSAALRVLIVHVLFPPQTFGGATRVVRDNVDDLLARYGEEIEVAVYSTDFDAAAGTSRVGRYGSVPVFRYGRNSWTEFTYRDDLAADHFGEVLKAWRPDLVHFHCIQFLTGSLAQRCKVEGIPYLVTLHDAWWVSPYQFLVDKDFFLRLPSPRALQENPTGAEGPKVIDRKRYLADRLHEAATVTAVSDSFAQIYRSCGFAYTRAVPNGLSPEFLERRDRSARKSGPRKVRIGHIGGRLHHKGVHLLQIALRHGGFEHLEALVIDHTQEPGFQRQDRWGTTPVLMRGTVPQDRVLEIYEGLDVLIAPSIWPESFGLVSREALALGLWVVVSNLGALGEDVVEGENGFVIDVSSAEDLTRVLKRIDGDPDRFMQPPAIRFQPRSATEQTDDFVAIYREITGGGRRNTTRAEESDERRRAAS